MRRPIRVARHGAAVTVGALLLTGCLQSDESTSGASSDTAEGDGQVEIIGAIADAEATALRKALKPFEDESGIEVTYTPSTDFTTEINSRIQGGNPPEVALFPQPGLVMDLAETGDAVPLNELVDVEPIKETLIPGFLEAVTDEEDNVYAVPMRMAVKSLVWYPKQAWADAGYEVPETWEDLIALSDQMVSDGQTPWCIGAESGSDTGWVFTDWVEELMLRTAGPETYAQWYQHEIPFDDPAVQEAGSMFGEQIMFQDGYVFGGPNGALTTAFGDADDPMWKPQPGCMMMRNGNFITGFFPDDVQANLDEQAGVFVLPPVTDGFDGTPILGGGDMAVAFANDTDVVELMEFMGSEDFGGPWAQIGGWLSPHKTFDESLYPDETTREMFRIAAGSDVFGFDASDSMPGSVGAGSFWDEMNDWVAGKQDLETALQNIEESWPAGS